MATDSQPPAWRSRSPRRCSRPSLSNVLLIVLGVILGVVVAVPAARLVRMTQMPQMVALFNGVGGGAVALIAWVEFRSSGGFDTVPTNVAVFSLFAAIIGSISFWGSLVAFGKLQELLPGRPLTLGRPQTLLNGALAVAAIACAAAIVGGSSEEWLFVALLVTAGALGVLAVLPIGGADMPVVISILNALTGLSAAATGVALNNTSLIVGGMLVGASGSILTRQMAEAMNRSIVVDRRRRLRRNLGGEPRPRAQVEPCAPRPHRTSRSSSRTPGRW